MQRDAVVLSLRPCKISETSFTYLKAESYNRCHCPECMDSPSLRYYECMDSFVWVKILRGNGGECGARGDVSSRLSPLPASKDGSLLGYSFQKYLCLWPHKAFISTVLLYCHTLCPQNTCLVFCDEQAPNRSNGERYATAVHYNLLSRRSGIIDLCLS